MNIFKKILLFLNILLLAFLLLVRYQGTPVLALRIQSDSMLPALKTGDMVFLDKFRSDQYNGRIIAFFEPIQQKIIVHRIIGKSGDCFLTKGDNNEEIDFFNPCSEHVLGLVR